MTDRKNREGRRLKSEENDIKHGKSIIIAADGVCIIGRGDIHRQEEKVAAVAAEEIIYGHGEQYQCHSSAQSFRYPDSMIQCSSIQ